MWFICDTFLLVFAHIHCAYRRDDVKHNINYQTNHRRGKIQATTKPLPNKEQKKSSSENRNVCCNRNNGKSFLCVVSMSLGMLCNCFLSLLFSAELALMHIENIVWQHKMNNRKELGEETVLENWQTTNIKKLKQNMCRFDSVSKNTAIFALYLFHSLRECETHTLCCAHSVVSYRTWNAWKHLRWECVQVVDYLST